MMKLKQILKTVEGLIIADQRCASDDMHLLAEVIRELTGENAEHKREIAQLCYILDNWYEWHLPNVTSIVRNRAQVLSEHPELKDQNCDRIRRERQREFCKFYKNR